MVDKVTWQLFNHTVDHYAKLQVLDDVSHFAAALWLNTSVEASITKEFHPSPDLFVMRPERSVGLIRTELALETFAHDCGFVSGI